MSPSVPDSNVEIPLRELQFTFARSSGPGGQNVNKVNSKATLRWSVLHSPSLSDVLRQRLRDVLRHRLTTEGELILSSQRFRDAGRNVADCLDKLRALVREASQPPRVRRPTRPSRGSQRRRLAAKQRRSQTKQGRQFRSED